jgi:hypothetical protein
MAIKQPKKAVPDYQLGIPGTPGKRYSKSSTRSPIPTGMDPANPSYGTMNSGGQRDPIGRSRDIFHWAGSSDLPSGQGNLEQKAPRSFGQSGRSGGWQQRDEQV